MSNVETPGIEQISGLPACVRQENVCVQIGGKTVNKLKAKSAAGEYPVYR